MSVSGLTALTRLYTKMLIQPQAIKDNAEWVGSKGSTPASLDTVVNGVKAHAMRVMFAVGATDVTMAKLNLYESADDSTYTEVAGCDFVADTTSEPTATDDNKLYAWFVNLFNGNRERYFQVEAQAGNGTSGTYGVCWADLFVLNEAPNTDAKRGLAASISV